MKNRLLFPAPLFLFGVEPPYEGRLHDVERLCRSTVECSLCGASTLLLLEAVWKLVTEKQGIFKTGQ